MTEREFRFGVVAGKAPTGAVKRCPRRPAASAPLRVLIAAGESSSSTTMSPVPTTPPATGTTPPWPASFHVGFELPTRADVESLHARMVAAGVTMETGVIDHVRGSRFFCRAPGGVMFELNTRADAAPAYRGTFD